LMLLTVYFFWQGITRRKLSIDDFFLAGLFMALGMYTYFASRGVPLILAAFCVFLWLVDRARFKRHWVGMVVMFGVTAVLTIPLLNTLGQQPESEARVAELAVPVMEARQGNFEPLIEYTVTTLSMFHSSGDGEWLYNIPDRPVFGLIGALFFWGGVVIAVGYVLRVLFGKQSTLNSQRTTNHQSPITDYGLASAFLLAWWLAGISPGFISVPPASLGHTILAQPATFILLALPIGLLVENGQWSMVNGQRSMKIVATASAVILLGSIAVRDWSDYFGYWPERGMVRFLYRGDFHDMADYLNAHPEMTDVGVTGLLAGPWDRLALAIDLERPLNIRWYNPQRAVLLSPATSFAGFPEAAAPLANAFVTMPDVPTFGDYALMQAETAVPTLHPICFQNGLCVVSAAFDDVMGTLDLVWWVRQPLSLPEIPLISNPPPPGIYAGPRLAVFAHLLDANGNLIVGDDGLWVDPTTLQVGDSFLQQHWLLSSDSRGGTAVSFGLYNPMTGERILTDDGSDHVLVTIDP
ncbi:MAG: hypothetical protein KC421_30205, partial [Anaerolineales bacterium]|nr:hypothetical protein [Anaerolineales bacterium]